MHADLPTACENCATKLQGAYCHVCGQHAANPLRHFGHAVEEVFESFWHLDGRVFRTLRDLVVPGRVACNYLAGHRVRYIAPLRLFVILTVLTFFVGQIAAGVGAARGAGTGGGVVQVGGDGGEDMRAIREAKTVAAVEAELARRLAALREARENASFVPGVSAAVEAEERQVRAAASARIAALRAAAAKASPAGPDAARPPAAAAPVATAPASTTPARGDPASAPDTPAATREDARRGLQQLAREFGPLRDPARPWHEEDNPVDAAWVPAFADVWFNHRLANLERNAERFEREGLGLFAKLLLASVPPALFVLVPVFALLLRALYPFAGRGYLEHLVVALYSHATMLLVLLVTFAFVLLRAALPWTPVEVASYVLTTALWVALPVYLFAMQQRVYRQHWLATVAKYAVLGTAYVMLVALVALYGVLAAATAGA